MTAIVVDLGGDRAERGQWLGAACVALALHAAAAWALLGLAREAPPAPLPEAVFLVMLDGAASPQPAAAAPSAPPPPSAEERETEPEPTAPIAQALPDLDLADLPPAEEVLVHIPPRAPPPPKRPVARPKPVPPKTTMQPREAAPAPSVPVAAQPEATQAAASSATPATGEPSPATPAQTTVPVPPSKAELDWRARLLGHLERHKRYPADARAQRQEGVVRVQFLMDRHGQIVEARIERTSGYPILDAEALAMLKRAAPLPALPADMDQAEVRLVFPLRFALQ